MWQRKRQSVGKGIAAGLIGGLVASWVMNRFQAGLSKLKESRQEDEPAESGYAERPQASAPEAEQEPATVKVATLVARQVLRRDLPAAKKDIAGEVVHYAFGAAMGAAYGALAEAFPEARAGFGAAFGAALWLSADEIGIPAARLSGPPSQYPASVHASALASHAVFGVTTELLRRSLRQGWLAA